MADSVRSAEPSRLDAVLRGLGSASWLERRRAVQTAGALLRDSPPDEVTALPAALLRLAGDPQWEVRAEVANVAQHLRFGGFDAIVGLLENDAHSYVRQAARTSLERRRLAVHATETHLDEIDAVETRFRKLARDHSPKVAHEARELALVYLSALVSETLHDARTFHGVLADSHDQLEEVLRRREVPLTEWAEPLDDARRRARVLHAAIQSMALFASTQTSACERVNLRRLVDEVLKDLRNHFTARGQRERVELSNGVDAAFELDAPRDLLTIALTNVVKNAIEAVEESGFVSVVAEESATEEDTLVLVVQDDGCGIAPQDLQRVFVPGQSTKKGLPGSENTGWGLAVARRIVERDCGGRLTVAGNIRDGLPGGTTVTFELPTDRREGVGPA
jgi:signal transduction histidine kinase